MNLVRTIALLLITALANPFCCCLSGELFTEGSSAAPNIADQHNCCTALQEHKPDASQAHSPEDCPHRHEKDCLIGHSENGSDSALNPLLVVATFDSTDFWTYNLHQSPLYEAPLRFLESPLPVTETFAQAYCVYIL